MDFQQAMGLLSPFLVIVITQVLKNWISTSFAPLVVLLLGGTSALLGIGIAPGGEFVDGVVNTGWVSGLAALFYDLYKKLFKKQSIPNTKISTAAKTILIVIVASSLISGCATMGGKPWAQRTPVEKSLAFMQFYNTQYQDTMLLTTSSSSTAEQKKMAMQKKAVLSKLWPLIDTYDSVAVTGGFPSPAVENQILDLINQLGGAL